MEGLLALVVDGDTANRMFVQEVLSGMEGEVLGAATWREAVEILQGKPVRVLLINACLQGRQVAESIREARHLRPTISLIVTGMSARDGASLGLVKAGASEVLDLPLDEIVLRSAMERAADRNQLLEELRTLREEIRSREGYRRLVGRSETITRLREAVERLARGDGTVVLCGEYGTGRELAARTLHARSTRAEGKFVVANCSGPRDRLLEEEIFGASTEHEGDSRYGGLLSQAMGGTLYLDGIDVLPERLQVRLRNHLEMVVSDSGKFPRILASSSAELSRAVEDGRFREDLYEQLLPTLLLVPPLRERPEDIPVLSRYFIDTISRINNLPPIQITPEALASLQSYSWPGNVRELRNAMEQAAILALDAIIHPRDLPVRVREKTVHPRPEDANAGSFRDAKREVVDSFEQTYLDDLMARNRGNVTAAARQAGMLRSALQRLLRKHSLRSADYRRREPPVS